MIIIGKEKKNNVRGFFERSRTNVNVTIAHLTIIRETVTFQENASRDAFTIEINYIYIG